MKGWKDYDFERSFEFLRKEEKLRGIIYVWCPSSFTHEGKVFPSFSIVNTIEHRCPGGVSATTLSSKEEAAETARKIVLEMYETKDLGRRT